MDIQSAQAKGFGGHGGKQYVVEYDITPLKKRVLVSDMQFGATKSKGGIILLDDDVRKQAYTLDGQKCMR